jgi:hypothetical protein
LAKRCAWGFGGTPKGQADFDPMLDGCGKWTGHALDPWGQLLGYRKEDGHGADDKIIGDKMMAKKNRISLLFCPSSFCHHES